MTTNKQSVELSNSPSYFVRNPRCRESDFYLKGHLLLLAHIEIVYRTIKNDTFRTKFYRLLKNKKYGRRNMEHGVTP